MNVSVKPLSLDALIMELSRQQKKESEELQMTNQILTAINWNDPKCEFYNQIFLKQSQQFWLPEEIPLSKDKDNWLALEDRFKDTYKRILAGLTLLDTQQTTGINKIGEISWNQFIESICSLFGGFEAIHARSYSTIFQTLCTNAEIEELFQWVEETSILQKKVSTIIKRYGKEPYMSYVASLCLEGICFYSGFFLPLWLAGQGKMVNSGEIISLILRDEALHTLAMGRFAQDFVNEFNKETGDILKESYTNCAFEMIKEVYEVEVEYTKLLYKDLPELIDEVITYIQYNVNYSLECLGLKPMFEVTKEDVNPIVMNGYSTDTKNHDFFSSKGNGYVKATNVGDINDDIFDF